MTLHRLTLKAIILRDYEKRGVFPRWHYGPHILMDDLCPAVATHEIEDILEDAELNIPVRVTGNPNLSIAYNHLAEKCRSMLRRDKDENHSIGRIGKDAASGD